MPKKRSTKAVEYSETQNTAVKARVAEVTVDSALKSLSAAQAQIGKTLAGVGEQVQDVSLKMDDLTRTMQAIAERPIPANIDLPKRGRR